MKEKPLSRRDFAFLIDLLLYLILDPLSEVQKCEKDVNLNDVLARHSFDRKKINRFMQWFFCLDRSLRSHAGSLERMNLIADHLVNGNKISGAINFDLAFLNGYTNANQANAQIYRLTQGLQTRHLTLAPLLAPAVRYLNLPAS